jgi:hypothetical protein
MSTYSDVHPDSAEILADLPLRARPSLYVEATANAHGNFLVLEEGPDDDGSAGIIGLAICGEDGNWYLGCIECRAEIEETDSGMCRLCREDAAWQEQARPERDWED